MGDHDNEYPSIPYNSTLDQSPLSLGLRPSNNVELFITPPKKSIGEEGEIGMKRYFDNSARKVLTYGDNARLCKQFLLTFQIMISARSRVITRDTNFLTTYKRTRSIAFLIIIYSKSRTCKLSDLMNFRESSNELYQRLIL